MLHGWFKMALAVPQLPSRRIECKMAVVQVQLLTFVNKNKLPNRWIYWRGQRARLLL